MDMVQTTETHKVLADLEAKAAKLESRLAETRKSLQAVRAQIAEIKNGRSPIYGLPYEVLEGILHICHLHDLSVRKDICNYRRWERDESRKHQLPFSVIASHVSQRWRDVAINSARLWTTIDLLSFQPEDLFQVYLERSKDQSLNVTFCEVFLKEGRNYAPTTSSTNFLPILPHMERCHSITVLASAYASAYEILAHLRDVAAPRLRYLEVDVNDLDDLEISPHSVPESVDLSIFKGGSPILASLKFVGISLYSCSPSPSSLTEVDFDTGYTSVELTYDAFRSFLLDAVSLTRLALQGRVVIADADDRITQVVTPNLVTLCVSDPVEDSNVYNPLTISGTVVAPRLRSLYLRDMDGPFARGFMIQPEKWNSEARYPLLQSLRMIDIYYGSYAVFDIAGYLEDLASATPSITHLTLVDKNHGPPDDLVVLAFIRDHDATITPSVLWPQLRTITANVINFQLLREVVSGRIAAGCPLKKLCLPSDTPPDELTWFSDQLEVEMRRDDEMLDTTNF